MTAYPFGDAERIKVRTGSGLEWRAGTAHILDDDACERRRLIGLGSPARRLCMSAAAVGDTDALTVRVDLDGEDGEHGEDGKDGQDGDT